MLQEGANAPTVVHDHHLEGVFARSDWLRWLDEAGFDARVVSVSHCELADDRQYEVFVGRRRPGF